MSAARQDPRWQEAQGEYVAEHEDADATDAFIRRTKAAIRMYEIEREYRNQSGNAETP